jgi:hypothetical protein
MSHLFSPSEGDRDELAMERSAEVLSLNQEGTANSAVPLNDFEESGCEGGVAL